MFRRTQPLAAAAAALSFFALVGSTPAAALQTRVWVSGRGVDDASCGPLAAPCRTLQYAHNMTAPSGEIDVMDSAEYGPLQIRKAISIVNDGAGVAVVRGRSIGAAIAIDAGASDFVLLRGLTIDGSSYGKDGVVMNSGAALEISKCVIEKFTRNGVMIATSGQVRFVVADTDISVIGGDGILAIAADTMSGLIERVRINAATQGVDVIGAAPLQRVVAVTAKNVSVASALHGFIAAKIGAYLTLIDSVASGNANGVTVVSGGSIILSRSTIAGSRSAGVDGGGTVVSAGDNIFVGNAQDVSGAMGTLTKK